MRIGMVGLGRMGGAMAERLRAAGHEVVGYDPAAAGSEVAGLPALAAALDAPRAVWVMVPAGRATEDTVAALGTLLQGGDVVVDGGNARYRDSLRRAEALAARDIAFVDAGVSGGVWGAEQGYGLMVGGDAAIVDRLRPIFDALTPQPGVGFAHAGPVGAGHFAKMVHNAVEYGLMQAYAEGYELLAASPLGVDVQATLAAWRSGTVIRSWLLDLLVRALEQDPGLASLAGYVEDSGEGRWAVQEAVDLDVPAPVIATALFARFASRQDDSPAMRAVAALREGFGGHRVRRP